METESRRFKGEVLVCYVSCNICHGVVAAAKSDPFVGKISYEDYDVINKRLREQAGADFNVHNQAYHQGRATPKFSATLSLPS